MNATTEKLTRLAATAARASTPRASPTVANDAQRESRRSARSTLHAAVTILLGLAVVVLAVKWSDERTLRRQAEARAAVAISSRAQAALMGERWSAWPGTLSADIRVRGAQATLPTAGVITDRQTMEGSRDRDFQLQLRRQLSDPAMRSALRGQQRSAVLQLYGDLLRSWHLSTDKSDRVLDLLAEQQLQEMEQSLKASNPASTGATGASTEAAIVVNSDELNAVLSDQQRKELQRQQDSLSERLTVGSLADELSLAQLPLTDSQREQLTQAMVDERKAVPVPDVSNLPANSPDAQRALEDWQSALDQRVQDRAATILTSAQQSRFEQFMSRQRGARDAFSSVAVAQTGDNAVIGDSTRSGSNPTDLLPHP